MNRFLLALPITLFSVSVFAMPPGQLCTGMVMPAKSDCCWFDIRKVRATQMAVGMLSIPRKMQKITNDKEYMSYATDKPAKLVFGPDGQFFMADGNHKVIAAYRSKRRWFCAHVVADYSNMKEGSEFWRKMRDNGYALLQDENGKKFKPWQVAKLVKKGIFPRHTVEINRHDWYRSLASAARKTGAIEKDSSRHYIEFVWANHLRRKIPLTIVQDNWPLAVMMASEELQKKTARHLPGYLGPNDAGFCRDSFKEVKEW